MYESPNFQIHIVYFPTRNMAKYKLKNFDNSEEESSLTHLNPWPFVLCGRVLEVFL